MSDEKKAELQLPPMALNFDVDAFNRQLAHRIVESSLGDSVKRHVDEAIAKVTNSWDRDLKAVVEQEIRAVIREEVTKKAGEMRQKILKRLDEDQGIIDKVIEKGMSTLSVRTY
ncbi:MAG: hypothetical protein OEZ65_15880 [Gemmatimonadota bacterium]|nr:hypothetical protein [Gemmatimonadota bacterium]